MDQQRYIAMGCSIALLFVVMTLLTNCDFAHDSKGITIETDCTGPCRVKVDANHDDRQRSTKAPVVPVP